ncbi:DUF1127 domain-containing protein [Aestuariicoccus sp. MJ-SS9]|uniref:DUF1127 domain-containing protein n=1 Tax=Aestuariicoccus sp. MJ-SS9 TaxID=3079855 RepID=UPI002906349D|nr:DUF1127 domain-containing protein [Aestuariicoccus sp. MJ-SS9]MDU8911173.1 DUF1127 domain-containing protein [Aestuariicoccus sp. MJ-SS9]
MTIDTDTPATRTPIAARVLRAAQSHIAHWTAGRKERQTRAQLRRLSGRERRDLGLF